jgi:hypothetical protein
METGTGDSAWLMEQEEKEVLACLEDAEENDNWVTLDVNAPIQQVSDENLDMDNVMGVFGGRRWWESSCGSGSGSCA